jgi:hypothetical protein
MELTYARCESILDTLPIGFYTGRRIDISLDKEAETSFYSPMEDKIVVSYPIIAHRMSKVPDGSDEEEAVRSMLYHEVSHAILTPQEMRPNTAVNIMEDERIESVLRNYYHGVNFRKQLYDLHGGHAPKAENVEQAFYNAVRFGLGTGKVQTEVNRILKKYAKLNRSTNRYTSNNIDIAHYEHDISCLWDLIRKEFEDDPEAFNEQGGESGEAKQMDSLKQGQSAGQNGENQQGQNNKQMQNGEGEESESKQYSVGEEREEVAMTMEQVKRMVGACLGTKPDNLSEAEKERLDNFQKTAEMIISNFNKKNKGGSGINAYSGVFNPRAVARKDYRFFERSMTTQGNNKFGTCHLNLIIDCSGSFAYNVNITNGIIAVLSEIERKNRNFTMDVAFINHEFHKCTSVRDRKMDAWGGNRIPAEMKQILLEMQKPQTCNYNIILFDGDAMCNNNDCHGMAEYQKRFGVFDMKQTTLITDPDNEEYMGSGFTSTKVVVTRKYTEELVNHITHALTIAFG